MIGNFLYRLFIYSYSIGVRLAAFGSPKARQWIAGRKNFPVLPDNAESTIWMHCASLGEFEQGRPLLETIKNQFPTYKIVLTFFSPSGYEVMKGYKGADYIFYLPMDSKTNAKKMIAAINPCLVLWVKYEFWFFYLTQLKKKNIPVLMVSGLFRQSQPFFKWYGGIWRKMLQSFTHIFVQNEASKKLLVIAGIKDNVGISGDTRFDRVIAIALQFEPMCVIEKFCGNSNVIVAGSTWEDDEAELVHYVRNHPEIKFIIAPHEVDAANLKDVKQQFAGAVFYSELQGQEQTVDGQNPTIEKVTTNPTYSFPVNNHVLIIDNIGMLSKLYHYAHITYIGGGFGEDGIHNVLEPAVYGKPVIYGPVYEKFAEAVELVDCGAGITINNALELENVFNELWADTALLHAKGEAAKKYVYSKAGATQKVMAYIQEKRLLIN